MTSTAGPRPSVRCLPLRPFRVRAEASTTHTHGGGGAGRTRVELGWAAPRTVPAAEERRGVFASRRVVVATHRGTVSGGGSGQPRSRFPAGSPRGRDHSRAPIAGRQRLDLGRWRFQAPRHSPGPSRRGEPRPGSPFGFATRKRLRGEARGGSVRVPEQGLVENSVSSDSVLCPRCAQARRGRPTVWGPRALRRSWLSDRRPRRPVLQS